MREYEIAVVLETIRVRAESEEQAEEMYARWNQCGVEDTCPHHPDIRVGQMDWDCGCAWTDEDIYHTTTNAGPWTGNPWRKDD